MLENILVSFEHSFGRLCVFSSVIYDGAFALILLDKQGLNSRKYCKKTYDIKGDNHGYESLIGGVRSGGYLVSYTGNAACYFD